MRNQNQALLAAGVGVLLLFGGCGTEDTRIATQSATTSTPDSPERSTPVVTDASYSPANGGPEGCASDMEKVLAGADWSLSRGVSGNLPSLYEVSVHGEPIFGGCGADVRATEAGFMSWFYAHVGHEVVLFGEVPPEVAEVVVNGETAPVRRSEGSQVGFVALALTFAQSEPGVIDMEAVWSDGARTTLAPTSIDPQSNTGYVIAFNR